MKEELKFTLRIDKELHKELLKSAEKHKRSLNSEILYLLEKQLEEQKKSQKDSK